LPTSTALRAFAEAPSAYFDTRDKQVVVDPRFHVTVSKNRKWANACRLAFDPAEAPDVVEQVHALEPGALVSWLTPHPELADGLRAAGCRDPGPPLLPTFTALATETEPPDVPGIEIRRVESFDDFLTLLELMLSSENWTDEARERQRADARHSYEIRLARPAGDWLACIDGRPVAAAGAIVSPRGLFLSGAATHPDARGRGCYRALIRARWDEAVRLGTPALVVHAQETSRPILESVGFERVCTLYELESGPSPAS
jgi:GNAT superfamily N-acetyltransferase